MHLRQPQSSATQSPGSPPVAFRVNTPISTAFPCWHTKRKRKIISLSVGGFWPPFSTHPTATEQSVPERKPFAHRRNWWVAFRGCKIWPSTSVGWSVLRCWKTITFIRNFGPFCLSPARFEQGNEDMRKRPRCVRLLNTIHTDTRACRGTKCIINCNNKKATQKRKGNKQGTTLRSILSPFFHPRSVPLVLG